MRDTDRRVKYTKMVLRESLLKLMEDKPLDRISVTELCQTADVNRGTFYAHYKEPADLFSQIEEEFYSGFEEIFTSNTCGTLEAANKQLMELIDKNRGISRIMLGENGNLKFIDRIHALAKDSFHARWNSRLEKMDLPEDYVYDYVAAGCVEILRHWLTEDSTRSIDDMADIMSRMVLRTMNAW